MEIDRELTQRFPALFERKRVRLLASPHGFLRGSAPLFYEILEQMPDHKKGPTDRNVIVGNMHVENLGAYKSDNQRIIFDLNNFDDTTITARNFDILHLATNVILSGR